MSRLTLTAPNHEKPQNKKGSYFRNYLIQRAENGTQTRDPQLGRLVLYQLSYFRIAIIACGYRWIRTTEGESQQIYSLPHLATLECTLLRIVRDSHRIQTYNLLIRSQMLYSVELAGQAFVVFGCKCTAVYLE